jgi:trigger factor
MQVTLETTTGLERRLHISVPCDQVDTQVEEKLKETAKEVRLKGFRPGKVPMREVRRRFGDSIRAEVSSEIMQSSYSEAVQQEEVSPAGMPQIEDVTMESGKDLQFTAVFEVLPEVQVGGFEGISVEKVVAVVEEDDLDRMIENLREQRIVYNPVDRVSQEKDQVNIDFTGTVDGEVFEGGKGEGADIVIGSGSMLPEFEQGLIGASKGDEKDIDVEFPEDYRATELAGSKAVFHITFNAVAEAQLPDIDEEFMKQFGVEEGGMEAFRAEIRKNMEKELESSLKNKVKTQVMDGLLDTNEVDLPQALIESEINRMRQEAVQQFGGGNANIDPSILPAEMFQSQAERRVSLGLIVNAIVDQQALKVDDDRVREVIEDMASSYEEPQQFVNYYYSNEEQLSNIQNMVLEDQIIDMIVDKAEVSEVSQGYEEAIKPPPPPVPDAIDDASADSADADGENDNAASEGNS